MRRSHNKYEAAFQKGCVSCGAEPSLLVARWSNQTDSGQNKLPPSEKRAEDRSKTYQGIADAIADQWSKI